MDNKVCVHHMRGNHVQVELALSVVVMATLPESVLRKDKKRHRPDNGRLSNVTIVGSRVMHERSALNCSQSCGHNCVKTVNNKGSLAAKEGSNKEGLAM